LAMASGDPSRDRGPDGGRDPRGTYNLYLSEYLNAAHTVFALGRFQKAAPEN
jgi:hypothetical protein